MLTPMIRPFLGLSPKWEKTSLRCGQTAMQDFTQIGKAAAENYVTVHKQRKAQ